MVVLNSSVKPPADGIRTPALRTGHDMSPEEVQEIKDNFIRKYADVFGPRPKELPPLRDINHKIPLIDEKLVYKY